MSNVDLARTMTFGEGQPSILANFNMQQTPKKVLLAPALGIIMI
jgi:hypothetical protein